MSQIYKDGSFYSGGGNSSSPQKIEELTERITKLESLISACQEELSNCRSELNSLSGGVTESITELQSKTNYLPLDNVKDIIQFNKEDPKSAVILLYDFTERVGGKNNWAGIGVDTGGRPHIRLGVSNATDYRFDSGGIYLNDKQVVKNQEPLSKTDLQISKTVTIQGQYAVDATQLNPNINGSIAKQIQAIENKIEPLARPGLATNGICELQENNPESAVLLLYNYSSANWSGLGLNGGGVPILRVGTGSPGSLYEFRHDGIVLRGKYIAQY